MTEILQLTSCEIQLVVLKVIVRNSGHIESG